jgi:hypothetical protein
MEEDDSVEKFRKPAKKREPFFVGIDLKSEVI